MMNGILKEDLHGGARAEDLSLDLDEGSSSRSPLLHARLQFIYL